MTTRTAAIRSSLGSSGAGRRPRPTSRSSSGCPRTASAATSERWPTTVGSGGSAAGRLAGLQAVCMDGGTTVLEVARLLPAGVTMAVSGPDVIDALRRCRFDACLLGVCSLDRAAGLTVPDRDEAFVKSAMVERSTRVIAVAAREKLRTAGAFVVAPAETVTVLVTDAEPNDPAVAALSRIGVEVVCVTEG